MAKKNASWGFDVRELTPAIRPQDDFFHHVHQRWIDANPIPKTESRWGSFQKLRFDVEKQLRAIVEEVAAKDPKRCSKEERMVRDFYTSGMDSKARNARGLAPLAKRLAAIENAQDLEAIQGVIADLHTIGVGVIWGIGVDQDMKDVDSYAVYLGQDGLGLPDRDYYLKQDAESLRVRTAYEAYVAKLFALMGRKDAASLRDAVLRIETALARASMKKEDLRDPEKIYHKYSLAKLQKLAPAVSWKRYLARVGAEKAPYLLVMQPEFFARASELLQKTPLEDLKTYLAFHLVNDYAGALSEPYAKLRFSFYGTVLMGAEEMKPLWRRVLSAVDSSLDEVLGKLYVERHFPPEAKARMDRLVDDLFEAYETRLNSLTWMSPKTKKKALQKLATFTRKIGYPAKWRSYAGLRIDKDDYLGNLMRASVHEHKRHMRRLGKPMDRTEWLMSPQTVNAYYQPTMNDICFPAGILQPPFFFSGDDAINYGAIGTVIGHEITHGFDDEGSKFDAKGNLKSWWTAEDRKRFMDKARKIEKQFNAYTVADGVKVNGKLTLGENIADLGGVSIAYDAYQLQLARTGRKDIGGLSPEERFFIGFSLFEREHSKPEYTKMQVLTDPHSPAVFRINGPLSNFDAFYRTYGVQKGDALYRAPKDRETVW
ncbi:MAG TPA: M13 family metallopeptidase [Candidatus Paceibacterota bacterium]|nr:M13 family metallopeptidase [Candidatus Paceibacterota bacterium]